MYRPSDDYEAVCVEWLEGVIDAYTANREFARRCEDRGAMMSSFPVVETLESIGREMGLPVCTEFDGPGEVQRSPGLFNSWA